MSSTYQSGTDRARKAVIYRAVYLERDSTPHVIYDNEGKGCTMACAQTKLEDFIKRMTNPKADIWWARVEEI